MKRKCNFRMGLLSVILGVFLLVPALAQAKGEMEENLKDMQEQILKQMKIAPEKEKAFMALAAKYAAERQKIIAGLKQSQQQLQEAVAAAKPDEAKVKDLVCALTEGQDKLFASFKNQRDEELAQLTPLEQGKYLLAIGKWRHEMAEKFMKEEAGKKKAEESKPK